MKAWRVDYKPAAVQWRSLATFKTRKAAEYCVRTSRQIMRRPYRIVVVTA